MVILIPAFEPGPALVDLVRALHETDRTLRVVVVDDGSGPAYRQLFDAVADLGAQVLRHPVNRGKGAALRTGFAHVARSHPGEDVVCADCDGQHTVVDVLRVATAVAEHGTTVLGVRGFSGEVPLRSRVGNTVTRLLVRAVTRRRLQDTQTGLRGYPAHLLGWLGRVEGDRYEYETALLLAAARDGLPVREVHIATVYLDHNASSHFRPIVDSLRVYRPLLAFAAVSIGSFALDTTLLMALYAATGALLPSVVTARVASATANFAANRRLVFVGATTGVAAAAARYAALAAAVLVANSALLTLLTTAGLGLLPAKVLTEATLFVTGFLVQRFVVFRPRRRQAVAAAPPSPAHRTITAGIQPGTGSAVKG